MLIIGLFFREGLLNAYIADVVDVPGSLLLVSFILMI